MYYGDEKKLQMARSILPSKRRKTAKALLQIVRRNKRREARQELKSIASEEEYGAFTEHDIYRDENHKIKDYVRDRRDSDKISHFETWAIKITDGMEADARMAHMVKILPGNLIGWHARSHLRLLDEFELDDSRWERFGNRFRSRRPHPFQHRFAEEEVNIAEILGAIIKNKAARDALQTYMQSKHSTCVWPLSYGPYRSEREEVYIPSRKGWYRKYSRFNAYWSVTVTYTPLVTAERSLGPSTPPFVPSDPQGLVEFISALHAANEAPDRIESPTGAWRSETKRESRMTTTHGAGPKTCMDLIPGPSVQYLTTRKNPDHHPEWLQAVTGFCEALVQSNGDIYETLKLIR